MLRILSLAAILAVVIVSALISGLLVFAPHLPTSGYLVFASGDRIAGIEYSQIYANDLDHNLYQPLTVDKQEFHPDVSPIDGRVVFVSRYLNKGEVFVMDPDGRNLQQLTDGVGNPANPQWSPDGSEIIFDSASDFQTNIYVMDANGSNLQQLTGGNYFADPEWSPDGSQVTFQANREGKTQIFVMDKDGSDIQQVSYEPINSRHPSWSPDGSHIVYITSTDTGVWNLRLTNVGADDETLSLTETPFRNFYPSWSPDGSEIIFESVRGARKTRLYRMLPEPNAEDNIELVTENTNAILRLFAPARENSSDAESGSLGYMNVSWRG